ncbi:MAG: hypothetical protein J6P60_03725 [Lachnospiraceae bacterium]|nr:hypothetical protein [Lachnospiraceae bacterium]
MNTFEKIQKIARDLDIKAWPDVYSGKDADRPERWIVYNFADNRGDLYADDRPRAVVHSVQVHLYMPANKNFLAIQNEIRDRMFDIGFTFPVITVFIDDITTANTGTNRLRHIIFEAEIEDEEFYTGA